MSVATLSAVWRCDIKKENSFEAVLAIRQLKHVIKSNLTPLDGVKRLLWFPLHWPRLNFNFISSHSSHSRVEFRKFKAKII